MNPSEKQEASNDLSVTTGSPSSYDVFLGNNDYDTTGLTPAETLSEISLELDTAMSAVLLLRHGMSKQDALKAVDDLRWLVEHSDLENALDQAFRAVAHKAAPPRL